MPKTKVDKVTTNVKVRRTTLIHINRKKGELNAGRRRKLSQSDTIDHLIFFHDIENSTDSVQEDAR